MSIHAAVKAVLPEVIVKYIAGRSSRPTRARRESNQWLRHHGADMRGKVLSIGSGDDADAEGDIYRHYFPRAASYTTSEVTAEFDTDLTIDVRSMPELGDGVFDGIFCSGVLEHVDDYQAGLSEITRVLTGGGILLLGLPFRQAIHMSPHDFWRFTEFGIRYLLHERYQIIDLAAIDETKEGGFPAAYWVKAIKK